MNNRKNKIISYTFIMLSVTFVSKHFYIIANNLLLIILFNLCRYVDMYISSSGDYMLCYTI